MNRQASVIDKSIQDQVNSIIPNIVGDFIDVVNDSTKPVGTIATTTGLRATLVYNGTTWNSTRTGLPAYADTYTWLTSPGNTIQNQYHYWYSFRAEDHTLAPSTSGNFPRVPDTERKYRITGTPFWTYFHDAPSSCNWITGTPNTAFIGVGTGGKKYLDIPDTGLEFDLGSGFEIGEAKMITQYIQPTSQRYTGFSAYFVIKDVVQPFDFGRVISFDSQDKVSYVGNDFTNNDAFITNFVGASRDISLVQRGTQIKCGTIGVGALCVVGFSYHSDSKTMKTYVCTYDPTLQIPVTKFTGCSFADTNGVSPDTLRYIRFGSFDGSQGRASMKVYEFIVTAFYDETPDRMMTGLYEHYKSEA